MITLLDGPLGTELDARRVATSLPLWSAAAIDSAPDVIAAIHRDYAAAGATIHTANTFRTKRRTVGADWERLAREAVRIARACVPSTHRVAGSIAPLEDCYRPDLSPGTQARDEHRELAEVLADAGCDLLLCETHPNPDEAVVAVEAAVQTGVETWVAFTAGPESNLLSPTEMTEAARRAAGSGASAVWVNCTPATNTLPYVAAIAAAKLGVAIGAYANAGAGSDDIGWQSSSGASTQAYASLAKQWSHAGATLLGGCCGTTPAHIRALKTELTGPSAGSSGFSAGSS